MSDVQKEEAGDYLSTGDGTVDENTPGILESTELLVLENGRNVTGMRAKDGVHHIYRNGVRMAHFIESSPFFTLTCCDKDGTVWARYRIFEIPTLWWETHTALGLLEEYTVQQLLGESFALFKGDYSAPEDPLTRVDNAVLVHVFDIDEGREYMNATAAAFMQYWGTGLN